MPENNKISKQLLDLGNISYKMSLAILAAILFSAYSPKITSDLPDTVRVFFENSVARFAIIVLIIYLGNNNLELSLLIAAGISLMMLLVHKYEIRESLTNKIHEDFFIKQGSIEQFDGFETMGKNLGKTLGKNLGHLNTILTGSSTPKPSSTPFQAQGIDLSNDTGPSHGDSDEHYNSDDDTTMSNSNKPDRGNDEDHNSDKRRDKHNEHRDKHNERGHDEEEYHHQEHKGEHHQDHQRESQDGSHDNKDVSPEPFVNYQPTNYSNRLTHINQLQNNINEVVQQYKGEM